MNFPYWQEFLSLALVHFLIVVSPGPDFAVTVRQSLRHGRRAGLFTALGIGMGISVHVIYTLIGVSALMHTTPWMMEVARYLGAAYILWLGINFIKGSASPAPAKVPSAPIDVQTQVQTTGASAKSAFFMGFLTNATNPKAMLFFLAMFTTIVSEATPLEVKLFYGGWMCMVNALWFMAVALFFSNARLRAAFLAHSRSIDRVMGVLLILFAAKLLFSSF